MATGPGKELQQRKYPLDVYWEGNDTKFAGLNTSTTLQLCCNDRINRPNPHSATATTSCAQKDPP